MRDLAKVLYTGNSSYALDYTTKSYIDKYLVAGELYRVIEIREGGFYDGYYILEGWGGICFPPGCFIRDMTEYCRQKYHLK